MAGGVGREVVADGIVRVGADSKGLKGQLSGSLKAFTAFGTGAAGIMTAVFAGAAVKAAEFTKSLGELNTLGVQDIKALEAGVKDVSREFGKTLGDSVQAT